MENVPTVRFGQDEVVFREGESSNSVYLIVSGRVEIYRNHGSKKIVLATQGANTVFGEMALIDGKPRSASVVALETTFCYKCSALGILGELKKIDREVAQSMQHFAAIIRENNDRKLDKGKKPQKLDGKSIIYDETIGKPYMKKEDILANKELQEKVDKLNPFIKSMYRMLMETAYEQ